MKRILYPVIALFIAFLAYFANGYAISKDVNRMCAAVKIAEEIHDIERNIVGEGYSIKSGSDSAVIGKYRFGIGCRCSIELKDRRVKNVNPVICFQ